MAAKQPRMPRGDKMLRRIKREIFFDVGELWKLTILAVPVFLTFASNRLLATISLSFVGQLGPKELAAAGLATSLANVTGDSILTGIANAMQTLCGQAFGAKAYKEVGNWWQRAILILWVTCIPITLLWSYAEPILKAIGQEQKVAQLAALYLQTRLPGIWAFAAFQATQQYLQTQGIVQPPMYCGIVVAVLHPAWNYLFIHIFGWGMQGAAAAYAFSNFLQLATLVMTLYVGEYQKDTFDGFSTAAWEKWGIFLKLGLPSLFMLGEWWAAEAVVLLSGKLPKAEASLSAMNIFMETYALSFMIPLGLSIGIAVRTANELGAGQGKRAERAAGVAIAVATVDAIATGIFIFSMRRMIPKFFTKDPAVIEMTTMVLVVMAFYIALDCLQGVLGGVLRGTGRQLATTPVMFIAYYIIALPAAYVLAFPMNMGVVGLSLGMLLGSAFNVSVYVYMGATTDWGATVRHALERSGRTPEQAEFLVQENIARNHAQDEIDYQRDLEQLENDS